jgi:predicted TIM-barrel fold metal-dependent hydrolase
VPQLQPLAGSRLQRKSEPALRWAMVLPMMTTDKALEELHYAKAQGASAVFTRSMESEKLLSGPYFFPLYEEASKLNLPICAHASNGTFGMYALYAQESGFMTFKFSILSAFHDLVLKKTPEMFPDLRWAFVEFSAQWLPYALNDGAAVSKAKAPVARPGPLAEEPDVRGLPDH